MIFRLLGFLIAMMWLNHSTAAAQGADIRMVFVGDVMLADGPGRLIRSGKDPFRHVAGALKDADITIGNLECVIASSGKPEPKPYTFRAPKQSLRLLKKYFSAVSLANNHSGDFGKGAFSEMLQLLEQHQIPYFGGDRSLPNSHKTYIRVNHCKRISVLF